MPTTTLTPHRSKRFPRRLLTRAALTIFAALALVWGLHWWRQNVQIAHRSIPQDAAPFTRAGKDHAIQVGWEAWAKLKKADWDFSKMIEQNPGFQWKLVLPDADASGSVLFQGNNTVSFAFFRPGENNHGVALLTRLYLQENHSNRRNPARSTSEPRGEVLIWRRDGQFVRAPWHSVRYGMAQIKPGQKPELIEFYPGMDGYSASMQVPEWIKIAVNKP